MAAIGAVVATVMQTPAPVLMVDTCAVLDVVRAPFRGHSRQLPSAQRIAAAAQDNSRRCYLICSSLLPKEYADHIDVVATELDGHLRKLDAQVEEFSLACNTIGRQASAWASALSFDLVASLKQLSDSLMSSASVLDFEDRFAGLAMKRTAIKRPPAHTGKNSKDCQIFEEYLGVAGLLRAAGFRLPIVFMTSNSSDFCGSDGTKRVHPEITTDLLSFSVDVSLRWDWAAHLLCV